MYPPKVLEQIRNDLQDIRIFCGRYFPFLVIPLAHMRIIAIKPEICPSAGVSPFNSIIICPEFWNKLTSPQKRFVAMHESLHNIFMHPQRMRGFNPDAYNISADGKVNYSLTESQRSGFLSGVEQLEQSITLDILATITKLRIQELEAMYTEEIAELLEKLRQRRIR